MIKQNNLPPINSVATHSDNSRIEMVSHDRIINFLEKEAIIEQFTCQLCTGLAVDPLAGRCGCGYVFCRKCLERFWLSKKKKCPINCQNPAFEPLTHSEKNSYNQILLDCMNKSRGCRIILSMQYLKNHEEECEYTGDLCPYCQVILSRAEAKRHNCNPADIEVASSGNFDRNNDMKSEAEKDMLKAIFEENKSNILNEDKISSSLELYHVSDNIMWFMPKLESRKTSISSKSEDDKFDNDIRIPSSSKSDVRANSYLFSTDDEFLKGNLDKGAIKSKEMKGICTNGPNGKDGTVISWSCVVNTPKKAIEKSTLTTVPSKLSNTKAAELSSSKENIQDKTNPAQSTKVKERPAFKSGISIESISERVSRCDQNDDMDCQIIMEKPSTPPKKQTEFEPGVNMQLAMRWKRQFTLKGHTAPAICIAYTKDGKLISASKNCGLKNWNLQKMQSEWTMYGHEKEISQMILLKNDEIATCSWDQTIRIWNFTLRKMTALIMFGCAVLSIVELDNGLIAAGLEDKNIEIWNISENVVVNTFKGHTEQVNSLCSLKGGLLASASSDMTVRIWEWASGAFEGLLEEEVKNRGNIGKLITSMLQLHNGLLAAGCKDGSIQIWNIKTSKIETIFSIHKQQINRIIQMTSSHILTASSDSNIKIYNLKDRHVEKVFNNFQGGAFNDVVLLPDGMATVSDDNYVKVYR